MITHTQHRGRNVVIEAEAPLANLFGYSSAMRSLSQGRASCSMEPAAYGPAPPEVADGVYVSRALQCSERRSSLTIPHRLEPLAERHPVRGLATRSPDRPEFPLQRPLTLLAKRLTIRGFPSIESGNLSSLSGGSLRLAR